MTEFNRLTEADNKGMLSVRWDEARAQVGEDVIALSVADMDFQAPGPIVKALVERAGRGNYCYTHLSEDYYQAVASWFERRHNWSIKPEQVVPVGRMVESLPALLRELLPVGANVVVPYPAYAPTAGAVRAAGCHVVPWQLDFSDGRYSLDYDMLEWLLADADALVITNPHNPTGRVWGREELAAIAEVAEAAGVLVVSDEFHADFTYAPHQFCPYLSVVAPDARAVAYLSPGKTFNIAGLEIANIVVPEADLRGRVSRAVADSGCHNPRFFTQAATLAAYQDPECEAWFDQLLSLIGQHLDLVRAACAQLGTVRLVEPEGTYLAWLDCRDTGLDEPDLVAALAAQGLVLSPGTCFGAGGSGFLRMSLTTTTERLDEALRRLAAALGGSK